MSKFPSQTQDKFTVRFPDGMRDAIAKRAEANGRSMNSEIIQILQDALDGKISYIDLIADTKKPTETVEDELRIMLSNVMAGVVKEKMDILISNATKAIEKQVAEMTKGKK